MPILAKAGELADWNPEHYPLKQALEVFALESMQIAAAVGLAAGLMSRAYKDPLPESRQAIVVRILERLCSRSQGPTALQALRKFLIVSFGVNVVGAQDALQVIDAWLTAPYKVIRQASYTNRAPLRAKLCSRS